jgi:hypothetical protein
MTAWTSGWNLSGYLPPHDPPRFATWHEAYDEMHGLLFDAIERDDSASQDVHDAFNDLANAKPDLPWSFSGNDFTYWIEPADDDDEGDEL